MSFWYKATKLLLNNLVICANSIQMTLQKCSRDCIGFVLCEFSYIAQSMILSGVPET